MMRERAKTEAARLERNGLSLECFFDERGRLTRKIERYGRQFADYAYRYDEAGHLTETRRDGRITESYRYNRAGQRVEHKREYRGFSDAAAGPLLYDEAGRLIRAGDTSFHYDRRGALAERNDYRGVTKYFYGRDGRDTRPGKVVLSSGTEIRYEYDKRNPLGPARRYRNGALTTEFVWFDPLRLALYRDYPNALEYAFAYDRGGVLDRIRLTALKDAAPDRTDSESDWLGNLVAQERRQRVHGWLDGRALPLELFCGCDQVGTLKTLTDKHGRLVKEIVLDSFGLPLGDSFPDLFMPIGFAGGLTDPETGLVRFGYRDYDPGVGRFTAPDPLGDTGGDHDLYDYCIDDPVTMNDPSGLFPPLLLFLAGKALALGLGLGGAFGAATAADKVKSARDGVESTAARDAVSKATPYVLKAGAISAIPGTAMFGPGATTALGQRAGAFFHSSRYGDKIIQAVPHVGDFITGAAVPGPPPMTKAGITGAALGETVNTIKERMGK